VLPPVSLTGSGIAATHVATILPSPLAFGSQTVGTTSATQNLTVKNTGTTALSGMNITGVTGNSSPFARVTNGVPQNCGNTLAVGASCTVRVRFTPTAVGGASGTVTVGYNNPTGPAPTATLSGTGAAASVTIGSPTFGTLLSNGTLEFGNPAGSVSSTVTLTVVGSSPITFGTATVSGVRFSKASGAGSDTCSGKPIAGTCTITINFNGMGGTPRTGTLTVVDSTGVPIAATLNLTGN
jgi:hypothetical protein